MNPTEDVSCAWCPTEITAAGQFIERTGWRGDRYIVRTYPLRRPWELTMLDHIRKRHPGRMATILDDLASENARRHSRDAARNADPLAVRSAQRAEAGLS